MVLDQCGTELADRGRAVPCLPRRFENGGLVEVIAPEMLVDLAQNSIVLEEGRHAAGSCSNRRTSPYRVAEVSGVAELVTGCERRRIGGGERREDRVAV